MLFLVALIAGLCANSADKPAHATVLFRQYCFQCHGKATAMGGVNLEQLSAQPSIGDGFRQWEKVALVLEQKRMPPAKMPQPADAERRVAAAWVRSELNAYARRHDGDPGRVTVRRLTSGEYGYAIQDLTGLDLDTGIDASSDSAGGEGFTNFGDVQFMQDANVERYLHAAKLIANHAVIGAGPLEFFSDPGKTGFELSAITRIKDIYSTYGFRTVSGEGGFPFGLEKYGKVFYVAWRYQHRAALGEANLDLTAIAKREGVSPRFAQHIWSVLQKPGLLHPSSEMVARWRSLPAPVAATKADPTSIRAQCEQLQLHLVTWPGWLFARGDAAAGGAGDESPLIIDDRSLKVESSRRFTFNAGGRFGRNQPPPKGPVKIFLNVTGVNPGNSSQAVVIWKNPSIAVRPGFPARPTTTGGQQPAQPAQPAAGAQVAVTGQTGRRGGPTGPKVSLRSLLSPEDVRRLNFGTSPDGTPIGPDDFAAPASVSFAVPMPEGAGGLVFQAEAQLGRDRDQVFRILLSDREDGGTRGIPTRGLLGDPESAGYRKFKAGVLELATILPPNSNIEPTPADKDPVPQPFDSTFNVPEHDEFVLRVKYIRDDRFIYRNMLDDATRKRLDNAWSDLYASFEYHDNYLRLLAEKLQLNLNGKKIGDLTPADLEAMPADARQYVSPLVAEFRKVGPAQKAAQRGHVDDCLRLASQAWRRPLTETEKQSLRSFYDRAMTTEQDHRKAIRVLIARILVAPAFLYRIEQTAGVTPVKPLTGWEMASRLSFFLWSSIPDQELRRAAAAGELSDSQKVAQQVKRMLADSKARRLSTEFFGQWLGFYHFDQHRGVDTGRFPEFTDDVKKAMYDEAVSFFEHVIRKDRPVGDLLFANYTFLNQALARHYGAAKKVESSDRLELVEGANEFQRGGLLRLGAVLTATSAPLRTSPVKRGDWLLRRILGTPVPPPPADAGSIPADDKLFGGLSVRDRLQAHKRNPACANCHVRIDPLGFPLERYDSIGRWRDKYPDGKPVDDSGKLADQTNVDGVDGLLRYLKSQEKRVLTTLSNKLAGYALGRTIQASDQLLVERMAAAGGTARFSQLVTEIVTSRQFRNVMTKDASEQLAQNLSKAGKQ